MDALVKLPREIQVILGGLVLYVICSFLDWQSVSTPIGSYGDNLWHGFGVLVALVALVTLAWELVRAFDVKLSTGTVSPGTISAALALVLLVFTVIIFLDWSQFRSWPEYLGLILAIVIGVLAFRRARIEGVEMPNLPRTAAPAGGGTGGSTGGMSGGGEDSGDSGSSGT